MTGDETRPQPSGPGPWDAVAEQLRLWRRDAGQPSFTDIALRISAQRQERGMSAAAARVGRTTVYDAFRVGRTRINVALVREIGWPSESRRRTSRPR